MKLAYMTDVHLNFLKAEAFADYLESIKEVNPDGILLGGDIGQANSFEFFLKTMAFDLKAPIWFVLGNHDYYHGSIQEVENKARELSKENEFLFWLDSCAPIKLGHNIYLAGCGGWGDTLLGDFKNSSVLLNDHIYIDELSEISREKLGVTLRGEGLKAANKLRDQLEQIPQNAEKIYVLHHVPPFRESCWHAGKISDNHWLPFFASKLLGDALLEESMKREHCTFKVYCGHTHSGGNVSISDNLHVRTTPAKYGNPRFYVLNLEE
ncbi:metallophosphoesterase [bacterium]|nr:metallophosphoesterase [bacterium]